MIYTLYFTLLSAWCFIVFLASFLHLFNLLEEKYRGLSILRNLFAFLPADNVRADRPDPGQFFSSIRILVLLFTVSSHTTPIVFDFLEIDLADGRNTLPGPVYHILLYIGFLNLSFASSLLFVMSGTASSRWFFAHFRADKSGSAKKLVMRYYFERVTYIIPFYYIFIFGFNYYIEHMVSPQFRDEEVIDICRRSVIPNMLFVSNYLIPTEMCINWNWTYQVMIQLNLITPPFIFALKRSFRAGLALCLVAIVAFVSINYYIYVTVVTTDDNIYSSAERLSKIGFCSRALPTSYVVQIHHRPYYYGPPYFIGLLMGYLIETDRLYKFADHRFFATVVKVCRDLSVLIIPLSFLLKAVDVVPKNLQALESSLIPTIFSIIFVNFLIVLLKNERNFFLEVIKHILRHKNWRVMRPIVKVCFLINPALVLVIQQRMTSTVSQLDYFAANAQLSLRISEFFWLNYFLSVTLALMFDLPLLNLNNKLTKRLFDNDARDKSKKLE